MVRPLLPEARLYVDRAFVSRLARGQNNTLERAIRVSDVYSAVVPPVGDTPYTRDVAGGLQDLVTRVRALELDARARAWGRRAPEGVGVYVVGGGNEEAGAVD